MGSGSTDFGIADTEISVPATPNSALSATCSAARRPLSQQPFQFATVQDVIPRLSGNTGNHLLNGGGIVAAGTNDPGVLQDDAVAVARYPPPQPIRLEVNVTVDPKSIGLHAAPRLLRGDLFSQTTFRRSAFSSLSFNAIRMEVVASAADAGALPASITSRALRRHFSTALNVGAFFQGNTS